MDGIVRTGTIYLSGGRTAVAVLFAFAVLMLLSGATPASAAVVDYYVVADSGTSIPNAGTTNVVGGTTYTNQTDRVTLLSATNGASAVTIRRENSGSYAYQVSLNAYSPAYAVDTSIAANARFYFAVNQSGGNWDGWRVTLYDYDPATGTSTQLSQVVLPAGNATSRTLLSADFTNSATTIPAGHRLRIQVECDPYFTTQVNMYVNGAAASTYASYLRVDETVADASAPTSTLSASPAAPDGDAGWFKSPVAVTLSAVDPEGSAFTTYYDWNVTPPATVYAGSFVAPSGTSTLYYRSTDVYGNAETIRSQVFKVDPVILAPTVVAPTGVEPNPTPVQGTVNVDATAADATSGVNHVAFYYFAWNGSGWDAVGTQIGGNQTAPVSGSTYRAPWNTALVSDGRYKIQAQLRDNAGNTAFSPAQYVLVDNVGPTAALAAPTSGAFIKGSAYQIRGTASDSGLASWTVEMKAVAAGSWSTLATGTSSVVDAPLDSLDTTLYADGQYEFRLTAVDTIGNSAVDLQTPVAIDNAGPLVGAAVATTDGTVDVVFLEAVDPASVSAGHFTIAGLSVTGASLLGDGVTVRLTTSAQTVGAPYTVVVKTTSPSVTDLAGNLVQAPANAGFAGYDAASDVTPPAQLDAPTVFAGHERNRLVWSPSSAADVDGYNVYRDTAPGGAFATKVNAQLLDTTSFDDDAYGADGAYYYYRVTAVDRNGNESPKSAAAGTELVRIEQPLSPGGTSLEATNGEAAIAVPAGAVDASVALRVEEMTTTPAAPGATFVSSEYFFEPHGQTFDTPITITLKYAPGAVDESTIRLLYFDGERWRQVEGGSVVNQAENTVTGTVDHFSGFAAAAMDVTPPAPPTVNPTNGSTGFPVSGFVVLTFGEDMDPSTLTNDKVQIRVGGVPVSAETVVQSSNRRVVYVYPDTMLDISTVYTVWVSGAVTDLAGNPMGADFTSTFTTAATGKTPHGVYSNTSNLCRNCHAVHGAAVAAAGGGKLFTEATEKQVCYTCHDGTGSSYNVKTTDSTPLYAWDFGEAVIGTSTKRSYHPVPASLTHTWVTGATTNTGVTMRCSNCHNAHSRSGTGQRFLAVKKLDPSFTGPYANATGNDFCWACHNTTAATSAGYINAATWNASTGFDHKTHYPTGNVSHNMSTGFGALTDTRVPSQQGPITCKGCHSEHGSTNDKLISEWVKGFAVNFRARTSNEYNTTYINLCNSCHGLSQFGGFSWPGTASHNAAGHGASASTKDLSYSPPVPAVSQTLRVGQCKQCHEPHGTGDANGAFLNLQRYFEEGVCYVCHNTTGNPTGAKNLATVFGRASRHNLGLSTTAARKHDLNAEYAATPAGTGNARLSGANRHVECSDCHNTHLSTNTLHTRGSAAVSGVLAGVWGIQPTNGANWSQPSTWSWGSGNKVYPATFEYQICLKCHSAAAYGATPPSRAVNNTTGASYWPINTYTDQAREFNPNNASYHAVWGASKASSTRGTYVNGWAWNSRMYCSDCHRSSTAGDPIGAHGSATSDMLGGYTTPANAVWETGPVNQGSAGNRAARDARATLCWNCHDQNFANTGFWGSGQNLHTNKHDDHVCTACHSAVPHGWQRARMLVLRGDPAPYNDHGSTYGLPNTMTWGTSGNWPENNCHNGEGVGNCG